MRIAQPVDVIESQALQPAVRDQAARRAVNGLERAGILDAQPGQRIDVEKSAVIDFAAGEPPVRQPVVLALQQMMQREQRRRARRTPADRLSGRALITVCRASDRGNLGFECRAPIGVRIVRPAIARRDFEQIACRRFRRCAAAAATIFSQHFAVAIAERSASGARNTRPRNFPRRDRNAARSRRSSSASP